MRVVSPLSCIVFVSLLSLQGPSAAATVIGPALHSTKLRTDFAGQVHWGCRHCRQHPGTFRRASVDEGASSSSSKPSKASKPSKVKGRRGAPKPLRAEGSEAPLSLQNEGGFEAFEGEDEAPSPSPSKPSKPPFPSSPPFEAFEAPFVFTLRSL